MNDVTEYLKKKIETAEKINSNERWNGEKQLFLYFVSFSVRFSLWNAVGHREFAQHFRTEATKFALHIYYSQSVRCSLPLSHKY